jgi:zinc transport system substrate-binding protein
MKYSIACIASTFLLVSCSVAEEQQPTLPVPNEEAQGVINVMVSVLPQVDFVERIGGDKVTVSEMIPPGFSPATYDPSPEQLRKLQDADLYFRIGHIPFEKANMERLEKINTTMKVVDTSQGIKLLTLAAHSHGEEEGEHEDHHEEDDYDDHEDEEHHEEGGDPHIWLSPVLVKIQAGHIYEALVAFSPENEEFFTQNYEQFLVDLDALDAKLVAALAPMEGQTILVFHPAFGYLADAYGFHQESIQIDGKEPTPTQLQEIIDEAKADGVKVVFVQAQFSTKSAQAVAQEIGGAVVQIDPLAKDFFSNLESMAQTIIRSTSAE